MMTGFQSNLMLYIVIGCLIVCIGINIIVKVIRNRKLHQMVLLLNAKKFKEFDRLLESKLVKLIFDPFNIDYIRLNGYLYKQNKKEIDKAFSSFDHVRLTAKQKDDIDLKAFNYYLSENDIPKIEKYYHNIIHSESNKMKKEVKRLYDIYVNKGSKYLDELMAETNTLRGKYKASNELLISAIYANLGNKNKEKEYRNLAETHLNYNV